MTERDPRRERVLFVDDEAKVLDGLRRMLRSMRDQWDMEFVDCGSRALEVVESQAPSVIITDMRMPKMDGAELLDVVRDKNPDTVRIVLSGHPDADCVYRSMSRAHQFISKPCDSAKIKQVISRACALRDTLASNDLKSMLSGISELPSLPTVYSDLVRELESDGASLDRIGEIIETDVAMTAKILRMVNSALFSLNRTITNPADAVLLLGTETLKTLVLTAHVFSYFDSALDAEVVQEICDHSIEVANLARRIALHEGADPATANYAFTAGMMHKIGLVVLAANSVAGFEKELGGVARGTDHGSTAQAARDTTQADIGAYLLGLWGLPSPIVEAVAFAASPSRCPTDAFSPLAAVHVADSLLHGAPSCTLEGHDLDAGFLGDLDLAGQLEAWRGILAEMSEE